MKMKVMLVDDELLVRLGIKSLIDWEKHGFEFIGDAPDGEKALELMERQIPDILLTDIVMPRMDGLELIEIVKKRYPQTLAIVLSSHNEFDYVRKAMKLGVEDYLLKTSMKPSELLELLIEASAKLADSVTQTSAPEQQGTSLKENDKEGLTRRLGAWISGEKPDAAGEEELPATSVLLVLSVKQIRDGAMAQSAIRLLEHLVLAELGEVLGASPIAIESAGLVALLALPAYDEGELERTVSHLVSASQQLLGITLSAEWSGVLTGWEEIADFYAAAIASVAGQGRREPSREDIKRLLDYMGANYTMELSLKQAAAMINMSESYLSTIFKKETGLGFTDWINAMRIEQAAAYLEQTNHPSYWIAEQVGYENINYFGRIFKK